ncbi:MAG: ribonuclease P protein component [Opitutales bacterium]|jgi:ribonuclease P protein component
MRLPRERRIRASADFQRLRATGSRIDCGPFVLNLGRTGVSGPARFAVIAAKKSLPLAVDRNRAKRLARELFRTDPAAFPEGWEIVLVVRSSMLRRPLAELRRTFALAAAKAVAGKGS